LNPSGKDVEKADSPPINVPKASMTQFTPLTFLFRGGGGGDGVTTLEDAGANPGYCMIGVSPVFSFSSKATDAFITVPSSMRLPFIFAVLRLVAKVEVGWVGGRRRGAG
jgi:hypothetical protein